MSYHNQKTISAKESDALELAIRNAKSSTETRRLQCVYFRSNGLKKEDISALLLYSIRHVQYIWSQYFSDGIEVLQGKNHGGRRRFYLDEAMEAKLLAKHEKNAGEGKILEIDVLHKDLCKEIKKEVALSTTYRIAERHGWRKIEPRPYHPKRNGKSVEYFKIFFPSVS